MTMTDEPIPVGQLDLDGHPLTEEQAAGPLAELRDLVVMYSSGAGSWAAARTVATRYGIARLWLVFADVRGEDEDNYRFLVESAADVFGVTLPVDWRDRDLRELAAEYLPRLVWLVEGRTIWEVFRDERFLGNSRLASCSKILKQRPARGWLEANCDPDDAAVFVGIDWTEHHRLAAVVRGYAPFRAYAPLCDPPYLTREDVFADLEARGIARPRLYDLGMPHANCGGGCVRAGQAQFVRLLETMPERFAEWEANERALQEHLGKPVTILVDRSGGDRRRLPLTVLRQRVESRPEQLDLFDFGGCGCFTDDVEASA